MERFDVSPIKINHLAFKLSNSGAPEAFLQNPLPLLNCWRSSIRIFEGDTKRHKGSIAMAYA